MRFNTVAAAAAVLVLAGSAPAYALCVICNSSVRLDESLASCFAERADEELQKLGAGGKGFIIVDLGDCSSRGSLPTGNAADGPPLALDGQLVADAQSLKCLTAQIAAMDDSALTPSHLFDLTTDCAAETAPNATP
jgi:hypothetical protein